MDIRDRARALLSEDDAEWLDCRASIEDAVMQACDDRLAAFCQQVIPEAYEAYRVIRQPAYAAYLAIRQLAYDAYEAIQQPAWAAYRAIEQQERRDIILPAIMEWASHAH